MTEWSEILSFGTAGGRIEILPFTIEAKANFDGKGAVAVAFGEIVEPIQKAIAANHLTAQTLAALSDTLLPRLISGQLRLPDATAMEVPTP